MMRAARGAAIGASEALGALAFALLGITLAVSSVIVAVVGAAALAKVLCLNALIVEIRNASSSEESYTK